MKKSMKIINYFLLSFVLMFASSCSDDDVAPATIESVLTTSQDDYISANDGDWIAITEAEYDLLATTLNEVSKVATSDTHYDSNLENTGTSSNFTLANNNGVTIPNDSYVFAFKYNLADNSSTNNKVKQSSTSASTGFADLGGNLPAGVIGENYYVLKSSNTPTTDIGFLAVYFENSINYKIIETDDAGNYTYVRGDSNELSSSDTDITCIYQGLSTTQKQW